MWAHRGPQSSGPRSSVQKKPGTGDCRPRNPIAVGQFIRRRALPLALCLVSACAHHSRVLLPEPVRSEDIDALLARSPLAAGENIKAVPLQNGEHASVTLV